MFLNMLNTRGPYSLNVKLSIGYVSLGENIVYLNTDISPCIFSVMLGLSTYKMHSFF